MDDEAVVESVEPESAPDTGAEPVESPAPEPEPDPAPDWLNDVDASSNQYQAEPQGPPDYQRTQVSPANQQTGGINFSQLVENPETVLREFLHREVGPYIGNLAQSQQQTQAYQQQMLRAILISCEVRAGDRAQAMAEIKIARFKVTNHGRP